MHRQECQPIVACNIPNPIHLQVMVSASRQEMVGHLLKDIVESSEKPSLSSQDPAYDQFGFRQEELNNPETLEEKAEKLRRMTQVVIMTKEYNFEKLKQISLQENLEETVSQLTVKEVEAKWDGVVSTLSKAGVFTVPTDMKCLIR